MPDHARQLTHDISPSGREPDSEHFVRQNWTAIVKLRIRESTEVADGRRLLRLMPPRSMRNEFPNPARAKSKNP
jgi:hypothetical protein